jgi:hypothetical protein
VPARRRDGVCLRRSNGWITDVVTTSVIVIVIAAAAAAAAAVDAAHQRLVVSDGGGPIARGTVQDVVLSSKRLEGYEEGTGPPSTSQSNSIPQHTLRENCASRFRLVRERIGNFPQRRLEQGRIVGLARHELGQAPLPDTIPARIQRLVQCREAAVVPCGRRWREFVGPQQEFRDVEGWEQFVILFQQEDAQILQNHAPNSAVHDLVRAAVCVACRQDNLLCRGSLLGDPCGDLAQRGHRFLQEF